MRYRRADIAGGTSFFTVNLADRTSALLVDHVATLRAAVAHVEQRHPFRIDAWVVLPDHLHAVWSLPEGDRDFAVRWALIKGNFSRAVAQGECISDSRRQKGERGIWQRRYWEHLIRDEADLESHVSYIHINPVKHGLVARAADWPWSSIHRAIRHGYVTSDWACDPVALRVEDGGDR
ncbi:MAG: transposase [Dokdonella sp.]|nr:transposase [Dokdonella sp.]MCB1571132.1 transposase [Xanthomonadales bacterium]MCB1575330.1 transposase [Xanthomonadales bacterium]